MSLPPVYFNHLYLVLKDSTYRAILSSDFLRSAFSGMERRTTYTTTGEWWSGTYYYTPLNYLEFFGASAGHWIGGAEVGWAGLAFSVDEPGGAQAVHEAIRAEFGYEPNSRLRQLQLNDRSINDRSINWFYDTRLAGQVGLPSFDSWVMEYHPDIFDFKGLPHTPGQPLTRQDYLSPWSAVQRSERNQPVFGQIKEVSLRMMPEAVERYARVLRLLGYTQSKESDVTCLSAHGVKLRFLPEEPSGNRYRIHSLQLEMLRPSVQPTTFVFAPGSRLELRGDQRAEWFFGE